MYVPSVFDNLRRRLQAGSKSGWQPKALDTVGHRVRVAQELRNLGVSRFGLSRAESRYLPHIIHPDEHLGGVVYGRQKSGFVMMVATDRRVIYLDKKPLFINEDEINYEAVSGVSFNRSGLGSTVILHTRITDYTIRAFNDKCAEGFVEYIESHSLEREVYKGR